jgi:alkyl hydroperoxide reductase subunit F
MLDTNIKTQLRAYLEKIQHPIELVTTLDASSKAQEMLALVQDIAELSARSASGRMAILPASRRLPSAALEKRHASALPASRWGTNSPR